MNRSALHNWIGCAVALLLGAAAGALRSHFVAPPASATAGSGTAQNHDASQSGAGRAPAADASEKDTLAADLKTQEGAQRWLTLFAELETATAEDMPRLLRAAGDDNAGIRMLAARWAELNPRHMFNYLYSESRLPEDAPGALPRRWTLADVLMEEWVKSGAGDAAKVLTDTADFPGRENMRMSFVNRAMSADVEQGLVAMRDWSIRNYAPDMKKVADWAAADPRHAAEIATSLGSGYAAREALKLVGKAWGASDPQAALSFAASLSGPSRTALAGEAIGAWAARDLDGAVAFASAQEDAGFRTALGSGLLSTWAKTDPASALAWSEQNLQGTARATAISEMIGVVAKADLTAASELVSGMEPGAAQNAAAASIFATWFEKGADQRDAAFEWLGSVPDPEARKAAMERIRWNWLWKEPNAARDFLSGPHAQLADDSFVQQVARGQAAKNPEAAMQWASSLGPERAESARAAVLSSWLFIRPEGAAAYARALPAGAGRTTAIRTVSQTLVWQSPQQAAGWLRSLPASEQSIAREIFDRAGLSADKREQLRSALEAR